MTKHILDRERTPTGSARSVHYLRIGSGAHPRVQSKALQERPTPTDAASRTQRFLEIDRQRT